MPADNPQSTPSSPSAARIVAGYEVLDALGTSTLGKVYRAQRTDNGDRVVLQILSRPASVDEAAWAQSIAQSRAFLQAQKKLDAHPNIQHVLEFGEEGPLFYIASAYFEGRTLRDIENEEGPRPLEWLLPLYAQIASAIDYAASVGMSHTDLTPHNIFITQPDNEVRIVNFGLGHVRKKLGSPYLSPEQVNGEEGDCLSDIYSMGVILFECLSGKPAFTGTSVEDICKHIRGDEMPVLTGQPPYVVQIVRRMMTKSPENRYRVAVDAVTDLKYQRTPPPIRKLKASPLSRNTGALGAFKLEMALKNAQSDSPHIAHEEDEDEVQERRSHTRRENWLDKLRHRVMQPEAGAKFTHENAGGNALSKAISGFFAGRKPVTDPAEGETKVRRARPDSSETDGGERVIEEEAPDGVLGGYNKYMALQNYVTLKDEKQQRPSWRNLWRGDRRAGERDEEAYPSHAKPSSKHRGRAFGIPLPPAAFWRRLIWLLIPLTILAALVHAYFLTDDRRQHLATVVSLEGSPTLADQGQPPHALQVGEVIDGDKQPVIATASGASAVIQMPGSRLKIVPNSRFQIKELGFARGRIRAFDLQQGRAFFSADPLHGLGARFDVACQGVQVKVVGTKFSVAAVPGGAFISTLEGTVRVYTGLSKRLVPAGQQLTAYAGKVADKPTPMTPQERQEWQNQLPDLLPQGLVDSLSQRYIDVQDATLVPLIDGALKLAHLKKTPPNQRQLFDDAKALATAQVSLQALTQLLMVEGQPPQTLDLGLADLSLDDKERNTLLENYEGGRLLYYKHGPKDEYDVLARARDSNLTLFRLTSGKIVSIPEADEDKVLIEVGLEQDPTKPNPPNGNQAAPPGTNGNGD